MDTPEGAVIVRPKLPNMSDNLPAFRKQVVIENLYKHVEYLSVTLIRTQILADLPAMRVRKARRAGTR
jgi:hypothetical protein